VRMERRALGFRRPCDDRWFRRLFALPGWRFEGQSPGVVPGEARRPFVGNRAEAGRAGGPGQILDLEGPRSATQELIVRIHLKLKVRTACGVRCTNFLRLEIIVFVHDILARITHANLLL